MQENFKPEFKSMIENLQEKLQPYSENSKHFFSTIIYEKYSILN